MVCVASILKTEGLPGLYKGLHAQLLKTVLSAALMLAIKEKAFQAALTITSLALRARSSSRGSRHASKLVHQR
eukprot:869380-Prorocentrum_minimum.AAC.2